MFKEGIDNQNVVDRLNYVAFRHSSYQNKNKRDNRKVKAMTGRFHIAGTKDKRGITTQRVTASYITPLKLQKAVSEAFRTRPDVPPKVRKDIESFYVVYGMLISTRSWWATFRT